MQLAEPAGAYLPLPHSWHVEPAVERLPAGHSAQSVPALFAELPAAQLMQALAPATEYLPLWQFLQSFEESWPAFGLYLPAGQSLQAVLSVLSYCPAGQLMQLAEPAGAYLPLPHSWHVEPAVERRPAGQF